MSTPGPRFATGDTVRIASDEHRELVGLQVEVVNISDDGTVATVRNADVEFLCATRNLEPIATR